MLADVGSGWDPGGFPPWVTLLAKLTLFGSMLVRGVDLSAGDSPATAYRLSVVEAAAPIEWWGLVLTIGGIMGLLSILLRVGRGVLGGHLIGMAGYILVALGVFIDVVQRTQMTWADTVLPAVLLGLGGIATALAARWSRWQHAEITTAGIAVSAAVASSAIHLDGLRSATVLFAIGTIHGLMAAGTAARLRQVKILEEAM